MWNLPSVASDTYFESISQVPYNVSRDFGQLAVNRHFKVGDDCAIAGAAIAVAAAPVPIAVKNWRRFICSSIWHPDVSSFTPHQRTRRTEQVQCCGAAKHTRQKSRKSPSHFARDDIPIFKPQSRSWGAPGRKTRP